jgi:sulfatase maturation enzyme AslB (radical SAM superfamily)
VYDLRAGSLAEAWNEFTPEALSARSEDPEYLARCARCPVDNLCLCCPAHAYLETGHLEGWCEYFCQVAHARAEAIERGVAQPAEPTGGDPSVAPPTG